ncbi:hypothetical protein KGF56_004660 [Candida oxycetoniae]|uniref:Calcineurin-like phosphoesterase domain-containing protein n=1 Tax=Candida oxycetoniae TaxID=497107 RepID=A0AAI9STL9_9ASCO|nr:uncharacterized protein KGF56_004660 [Candida oxycetoniae]KAI3402568.2 hypothetical protein KGF56_004660 [Candida oxycetoniae]
MAISTSRRVKALVDLATAAAILLNLFIYFYPDLLNAPGQCNWANAEQLRPKYDVLNYIPSKYLQAILFRFPQLLEATKQTYSEDEIHMLLFGDPQINGNWPSTKYIKRLDNYGNDYYLGHIYTTMSQRLHPSHVAVMGDLFSSQWILDSEFYNRTYRYVERLFPQGYDYKQHVLETHQKHENYDWNKWLLDEKKMDPVARYNSRVYEDVYDWIYRDRKTPNLENPLFINLTGNHDIGYSGDATWQHMARFHHLFGQNNYVINYNRGTEREWRIVVLDSMSLEGPALQPEFSNYTWSFLENLRDKGNPSFKGSTILLTHIPMYKKAGLCKDGPEHKYYIDNKREPYKNGLLRSQNHLSYNTTQRVLNIVFPNADQNGIILTGHDHEGCDDYYNFVDGQWEASKEEKKSPRRPIREIVVKSMMGDFDGQTGILTGQFKSGHWQFMFTYCSFTVQHWWWASKISMIIVIFLQSAIKLASI